MSIHIIERLSRIWFTLGMLAVGLTIVATAIVLNHPDFGGDSREVDFVSIWAAAKLALAGDATSAYDSATLRQEMGDIVDFGGGYLLWLYPAGFHLIISPLGVLPFSVAYALVMVAGLFCLDRSHRHLSGALPGNLNLLLAAPVTLYTTLTGQPAIFFASAFAAGLGSLARNDQRGAGLWLGLLAMKPSLVPVVFVALAVGRRWQAIFWAAASSITLGIVATLVFGVEHWHAFFESLETLATAVIQNEKPTERMISSYAFLRTVGLEHQTAFLLYWWITAFILISVAMAFGRNRSTQLATKLALLGFAIPLITPYSQYYELMFAMTGLFFLARGDRGLRTSGRILAVALWLVPIPGLVFYQATPLAIMAPPLLLAAVSICLFRILRHAHGGPQGETNLVR